MLVSIHSVAHRDEATGEEPITMLTTGELQLQDDRALIRYEEAVDDSMPAQQVEVVVEGESATMTRCGDYATVMVFRKDCRYEGTYHTPYGDMELAVYCTRLRYDIGPDGGELLLSYQLDLNGQFAAVHDMHLRLVRQPDEE